MLYAKTCACALILSLAILPGCAKTVIPDIDAKHYPQCVRPFHDLQAAEERAQKAAATAGVTLFVAGVGTGIAQGDVLKGVLRGILAGAIGAVGAYSFASINQQMEESKRFRTIRATADANLGSYNRFQMYCYESMRCYLREFDDLQKAWRANRITKPEYTERYREIRAAMAELGKSIGAVDKNLKKVDGEYVAMMEKSGSKKSRKPRVARGQSTPKNTRALVQRINKNTKTVQREGNRLSSLAAKSESANDASLKKGGMTRIDNDYDARLVAANAQISDLRETNQQALAIMDQAALEAGIDQV